MPYIPKVYMPVIGPVPDGEDPIIHWGIVNMETTVQVTQVANKGLKIVLSNPAYGKLFAMVGGLVTFIPAGDPRLSTRTTLPPGAGALHQKTWLADYDTLKRTLPPGVPPMEVIWYLNVRPDSVRTALTPSVQKLKESVLQRAWNRPSSTSDRAQLEENFLDRLLLGEWSVFVTGGIQIGEAGLVDPTNPDLGVEFILLFDNAREDLSPILHLRGMPSYAGRQWFDHPLANAVSGFPIPVDIYLQFEVWNETSQVFEPLPAGIAVYLVDHDLIFDDILATQQTNAQGRIHFNFPNLATVGGKDIFFLVRTNGLNHAGHVLPDEWSTKGWTAKDGSAGFYDEFVGTQLGTAASPLVFRIGLDFHARFEYYVAGGPRAGSYDPAPPGISIQLVAEEVHKLPIKTDENGEVHGVFFDIHSEDNVKFVIKFEIEDSTINLPKTQTYKVGDLFWDTAWNDADQKWFPDNELTSIGTQINPIIFRCTTKERNVGLYFLKIVRELSIVLFQLTDGAWKGVNDLVLDKDSISGKPYSWPVGNVNIPPSHHWNRGTIIHELAHQIMWKEVDYSSLGIAYEGIFGDLFFYHVVNFLDNPTHALIEGWAEFIEAVFHNASSPPYSVNTVVDEDKNEFPLGPPPNNRGESVEGAFANGLWAIFWNYVVAPLAPANKYVQESINGDVISRNPWLQNSDVRDRFLSIIWEPFRDLKHGPKNSTDMLSRIKLRNDAIWHELLVELQTFNMAMASPEIILVDPTNGPTAGGQTVTIEGANLPAGSQVAIGGTAATNVVVTHHTRLTANTPAGIAGPANVVVTTPAGSANLPNGYTYA